MNYSAKKTIGRKLLLLIILFSSVVTLLLSCLQLFIDYKIEINSINSRLDEIQDSYLDSLEASLWNVDTKQVETQLEGILRLPDIQSVVVQEKGNINNPVTVSKGLVNNTGITREYLLNHKLETGAVPIGSLTVQVSLEGVYQRLFNKAITILLTQGVKTFIVSLFILYIFNWLVTRHLVQIGRFLENLDFSNPFQTLSLKRKQKSSDELDYLVDAYNTMSANLTEAYSELQAVNQALEQDIIARKKAEAEVKKLNDELENRVKQRTAELEAANQELGSFCYSVSHDLRAPLRRVEGFRRIIETDYSEVLDDKAQHYLDRIKVGTSEMNVMIESFLKLSRSTSVELVVEEVNLSAMVKKAIRRNTEKDDERNIVIDIKDDIKVSGDERLLELLVVNLVDNAYKYTREEARAEIKFYETEMGGKSVYVVEDNGVGFNMDYAKNLFAPFTRLHHGDTFEGVGIGLATVQRVVARHGGHVWADAAVGNGARFFFTLWDKVAS